MSGFAHDLPEPSRPPLTRVDTASFLRGVAVGFAIAMYLLDLWLALRVIPANELMAREFGNASVPDSFKLVISSTWRWGVPAVSAALLALLIARRPRPWWPYVALAIALAIAVVISWIGAYAPLHALAGAIR